MKSYFGVLTMVKIKTKIDFVLGGYLKETFTTVFLRQVNKKNLKEGLPSALIMYALESIYGVLVYPRN